MSVLWILLWTICNVLLVSSLFNELNKNFDRRWVYNSMRITVLSFKKNNFLITPMVLLLGHALSDSLRTSCWCYPKYSSLSLSPVELLIIRQCSVKGCLLYDVFLDYPMNNPEYLCTFYTPVFPCLVYVSVSASPIRLGRPLDRAIFYSYMSGTV